MRLIDELKNRRDGKTAELGTILHDITVSEQAVLKLEEELDQYDCAIAALEAALEAAPEAAPEGVVTEENVAAFVADKREEVSVTDDAEPDDVATEHVSILTGDPSVEPESGLHGEFRWDEASGKWMREGGDGETPAHSDELVAEPAYVGLQDAELDAEYEAMRQREEQKPTSFWDSLIPRKLEDVK